MKIINEYISFSRITKVFDVELENGDVISIAKSVSIGDYDESEWEAVSEEDKNIVKGLSDEKHDELDDFIGGLFIWKDN